MNKITKEIHRQLKSFFQAGKKWKPAENERDKNLSKIIAFISFAAAIYLVKFIFTESYISDITKIRTVIIIPLLLYMIIKFSRGVSISWLINGLKKYWIPTGMFLILYSCLAGIGFMILTDELNEDIIILLSASAILTLAVDFYSYFSGEVHELKEKRKQANSGSTSLTQDEKIKLGYSSFMKILWIGFLLGGIFGLLYAAGIADWFVVEILGW